MNAQARLIGAAMLVAVIAFIALSSIFTVRETQSAIVLRFGEPKEVYSDAGLRFKIPFIDQVQYLDKRIRELDQDQIEIIADNQERLIVDAFARYKIVRPLDFYRAVRTESIGEDRLSSLMNQSLRGILGSVSIDDIVTNKRSELMQGIRENLSKNARDLGIEVIDVKIRRADLPQQNSEAVFQRMITERKQLAQQIRSEGEKASREIRAEADRKVEEIKAKAQEQALGVRGKAEADRNEIFAAAYGKDPEFFTFYRSLLAYESALANDKTTIVVSPNSDFFRYFKSAGGKD